jgi:prepilin-type processing-associated H-X9-DG protein
MVELLVVIAILALLLAILVPSLGSSKQRTKAVLCVSNVKQLLLGLTLYEAENETFPHAFDDSPMTPPAGGYPGGSAYDRMGWWWFNHVVEDTGKNSINDSIIWCPSRQIKDSRIKVNVLCGNYGVNLSICKSLSGLESRKEFIGVPLSTNDIPHPSQTLLVVDSGYSMISWWHVTDAPPSVLGKTIEDTAYVPGLCINKNKNLWPGQKLDAIEGRHANKMVNVGFVDGHVRTNADDLFVEKNSEGYKNLHPLWLPK